MPIQDDALDEFAGPYLSRAAALEERREPERACAFRAVGSAMQLLPKWRSYQVARGTYFNPLSTGAFGEVPDMALFRRPEVIALLRGRALRTHDPRRRARLADVAWEFGGDAEMARLAIDAYELLGGQAIASDTEHAPMHGAAAIARALSLARAIGDADRTARLAAAIAAAVGELGKRDEHVALFVLVEVVLATNTADPEFINGADAALEQQYSRLTSKDADNFNFQRSVLALRRRLAAKRADAAAATRALDRDVAEAIVREAIWKGQHYDSGAFAEMHFLEEAAQRFEALGDHVRAAALRARQRGSFPRARFERVEGTVRLEAGPFQDWLAQTLGAPANRAEMWPEIVRALPVPGRDEIELMQGDEHRELPHLAFASVTTVTAEGVTEVVSATEGSHRRAQGFAFEHHALKVALLVKLASEGHGVRAAEAAATLAATGRFDGTGRALLERTLAAYDAHDWLIVGYCAGPLLERLTRRLAKMAHLETMRTDRRAAGGDAARRVYVSIEDLLARLPLDEELRDYLRWVVGHPGLNLRNAVAHGILEQDQCHEVLGAHVLYALIALAFADLAAIAGG